jgi:hypothetical protein
MHLVSPIAKKKIQCLLGPFQFWRQHIPHLDMLFSPSTELPEKLQVLEGE